jgi:hypothetical protein
MQRTARYFDTKSGRELTKHEALSGGMLRDGVSVRTPMLARDSMRFGDARSYWDRNKDALLVTDARGIGGNPRQQARIPRC